MDCAFEFTQAACAKHSFGDTRNLSATLKASQMLMSTFHTLRDLRFHSASSNNTNHSAG